MAADHASAMASFGLQPLAPTEAFAAFADAGYAPVFVRAGITTDRFVAVNTAKGPWHFIDDLKQLSAAQGDPPAGTAMADSSAAFPYAAMPSAAPVKDTMSLSEVTKRVAAAAAEAVGDEGLEGDGRFAAGAFDSLSAVELSNTLGKASIVQQQRMHSEHA